MTFRKALRQTLAQRGKCSFFLLIFIMFVSLSMNCLCFEICIVCSYFFLIIFIYFLLLIRKKVFLNIYISQEEWKRNEICNLTYKFQLWTVHLFDDLFIYNYVYLFIRIIVIVISIFCMFLKVSNAMEYYINHVLLLLLLLLLFTLKSSAWCIGPKRRVFLWSPEAGFW